MVPQLLASTGHSRYIISLDFVKAFDKAPHYAVINSLAEPDVRGTALRWFQSFSSERTQQVRVNSCYLTVGRVTSGVIQGSVVDLGLHSIFIDSLLRRIRLPVTAFADDLKFVADVTTLTEAEVESDSNIVALWAAENYPQLSLDKFSVLQCGKRQHPNNITTI